MVEVSLTVGKLDASLALLLTKDHHLIEFPTILLPDGISTGSIVKITCDRDLKQEEVEDSKFEKLQEEIFDTFGKNEPKSPVLKLLNVTQTSCVLEWDPLDLGTANLRSLTIFKKGEKLGQIKTPSSKKNIKLSGLPVDTEYDFYLKMDTSAGIYQSNTLKFRTHKMTDLSGITLCLGDIDYSEEKFTLEDIEDAVKSIGPKDLTKTVQIDTTQFICTKKTGIEYEKAKNLNIPIIRPEWIKACELERRIVGVNKFYLDAEPQIWKQKDFWKSHKITKKDESTTEPSMPLNEPTDETNPAIDQTLSIKEAFPEQADQEPSENNNRNQVPEINVTTASPTIDQTHDFPDTQSGKKSESEAKSVTSTEPSEPTENIEPPETNVHPTESAESTELTQQTEPTQQIEPMESTESIEFSEPESIENIEPIETPQTVEKRASTQNTTPQVQEETIISDNIPKTSDIEEVLQEKVLDSDKHTLDEVDLNSPIEEDIKENIEKTIVESTEPPKESDSIAVGWLDSDPDSTTKFSTNSNPNNSKSSSIKKKKNKKRGKK